LLVNFLDQKILELLAVSAKSMGRGTRKGLRNFDSKVKTSRGLAQKLVKPWNAHQGGPRGKKAIRASSGTDNKKVTSGVPCPEVVLKVLEKSHSPAGDPQLDLHPNFGGVVL